MSETNNEEADENELLATGAGAAAGGGAIQALQELEEYVDQLYQAKEAIDIHEEQSGEVAMELEELEEGQDYGNLDNHNINEDIDLMGTNSEV